ncbi:hypothetical protein ACRRTK_023058 [Alexandromys fortis]
MYSNSFSKYKELSNDFRPFSKGDFFVLPLFPTVFCSLWSSGGGGHLCLCNRQSVSMRLENIFLNSWGATDFPQ